MVRFLIILLILTIALMIGINFAKKRFRNFINNFTTHNFGKYKREDKTKEVIYRKDDVVVMKGEAGKEKNGT